MNVLVGSDECRRGSAERLACMDVKVAMLGSALRSVVFGATTAWGVLGVAAQGALVPNVNDCTFIRDPTAARDCIELYEGQRLAPGSPPAAIQKAPVIDESLLAAAGPIPAPVASRRGKRRRLRQSRRPITPAQGGRVEQVAPLNQ